VNRNHPQNNKTYKKRENETRQGEPSDAGMTSRHERKHVLEYIEVDLDLSF
jgi:hypothetical protein